MSTPSQTPGSPPVSTSRPTKMNKQTKIVILKLQHEDLARFLPKPPPKKETKAKSSTPSSVSTPANPSTATPVPPTSSTENASEGNSTPMPNVDETPSEDTSKKAVTKGPKPGSKRGLGQGTDNMAKPRGKPGPKKKPRLEDGTIDHGGVKTTFSGVAPITAHKLGPKANQGAINAGLRALDRSGKPCRKWERKAFQVKSFTGVVWELPSWRSPSSQATGDRSSDGRDVSQQSASNSKANDSSTAADSSGDAVDTDPMLMSTPLASSPAPVMAPVAVES